MDGGYEGVFFNILVEPFTANLARYLPERPQFMAQMPAVREVVSEQLTFRRRLVDEQAAFVRKMMKAMEPVLAKVDGPVTQLATGNTPQHEELRMPQRKATRKVA